MASSEDIKDGIVTSRGEMFATIYRLRRLKDIQNGDTFRFVQSALVKLEEATWALGAALDNENGEYDL